MDVERWFHEKFAHLREGGEWFKLAFEVEVFIGVSRWVWPRLDSLEERIDAIQKWLVSVDAGVNEAAAGVEGNYEKINELRDEVRVLKNDGILAAFGGE
jgi:hypothetical protein